MHVVPTRPAARLAPLAAAALAGALLLGAAGTRAHADAVSDAAITAEARKVVRELVASKTRTAPTVLLTDETPRLEQADAIPDGQQLFVLPGIATRADTTGLADVRMERTAEAAVITLAYGQGRIIITDRTGTGWSERELDRLLGIGGSLHRVMWTDVRSRILAGVPADAAAVAEAAIVEQWRSAERWPERFAQRFRDLLDLRTSALRAVMPTEQAPQDLFETYAQARLVWIRAEILTQPAAKSGPGTHPRAFASGPVWGVIWQDLTGLPTVAVLDGPDDLVMEVQVVRTVGDEAIALRQAASIFFRSLRPYARSRGRAGATLRAIEDKAPAPVRALAVISAVHFSPSEETVAALLAEMGPDRGNLTVGERDALGAGLRAWAGLGESETPQEARPERRGRRGGER